MAATTLIARSMPFLAPFSVGRRAVAPVTVFLIVLASIDVSIFAPPIVVFGPIEASTVFRLVQLIALELNIFALIDTRSPFGRFRRNKLIRGAHLRSAAKKQGERADERDGS